ncbi:MAG: GNAT family N-acetyltransferase [Bacteroidota bacterium]|nr:GNAT family N-acetyltransferase [Bacteroidota bacterium]
MLTPNFTPFPVLTTERLILRQLTVDDSPAIQHLRSNKEVMKYINRPLTLTIKDAEIWINLINRTMEDNNGITWGICFKEDPQQSVGNIGLWRIEKENHRAEIGYMLEPHLHRKGIMYEAIISVLDYGFDRLQLHSVEAKLDPGNVASAALVKKAGFVQEGYFKENYLLNDKFYDTAVYSIIKMTA